MRLVYGEADRAVVPEGARYKPERDNKKREKRRDDNIGAKRGT
jgi:hypothetical protein